MTLSEPAQLLRALRDAGSYCFLDEEGDFYASPPLGRVDWPGGAAGAEADLLELARRIT